MVTEERRASRAGGSAPKRISAEPALADSYPNDATDARTSSRSAVPNMRRVKPAGSAIWSPIRPRRHGRGCVRRGRGEGGVSVRGGGRGIHGARRQRENLGGNRDTFRVRKRGRTSGTSPCASCAFAALAASARHRTTATVRIVSGSSRAVGTRVAKCQTRQHLPREETSGRNPARAEYLFLHFFSAVSTPKYFLLDVS